MIFEMRTYLMKPGSIPEVEKRFFDEIGKAMSLAEARVKANPNDTKGEWRYYLARSDDYGATWHTSGPRASAARDISSSARCSSASAASREAALRPYGASCGASVACGS